MATEIAGLPFWELTFDADGDPDGAQRDAFLAGVRGLTDVILFAHGWNNDRRIAHRFCERFFGLLGPQLPAAARGTVGLAGVVWPSMRWSDEPIPDFPADHSGVPGTASVTARDTVTAAGPTLGDATLADLRTAFPTAATPLGEMARLLAEPQSDGALAAFHGCLAEFSRLAAPGSDAAGSDDGEGTTTLPAGEPGMLRDDAVTLFDRYRAALVAQGVELNDSTGGTAGIGDVLGGLLHGAKEALRQATYWQMKNRAGVVGRAGLGPLLGRLPPGVRVHLAGHSFGARLVSFALAGLPDGPSPVRAVTLLQGAFSQFAFARPLPFDAGRDGALAGMPARVNGPLVACFSSHDGANARFYPLASFAAQEDSAEAVDPSSRWGAIGANGARGVGAAQEDVKAVGGRYGFAPGAVLNIDASEVVIDGDSPAGAHSDIVHDRLTWVVVAAGGLA